MSTGLGQWSTNYMQRLQVKRSIQAAENTRILVYGLSTARQLSSRSPHPLQSDAAGSLPAPVDTSCLGTSLISTCANVDRFDFLWRFAFRCHLLVTHSAELMLGFFERPQTGKHHLLAFV